jgi:hypothetical protein
MSSAMNIVRGRSSFDQRLSEERRENMVIFEATLGVTIVVMSALAVLVGRKRAVGFFTPRRRVAGAIVFAVAAVVAVPLAIGSKANAAIVPTVSLATAANYSVLGGSTVTNTGPSVLDQSLGVWPGSSVTGFPPGLVTAPGTIEVATAAAQQAQLDLTAAYLDAEARPLDATTTADLVGLTLQGGVYAASAQGPLGLSGTLVLDGGGDPNTVFIFQTDSTLITGSGSTVSLINGAQECNVFWQVGSSATLGTGSVFAGNILALTSVTVNTGVTVHGRALAQNAAVTLDSDVFTTPTCDLTPITTTTTSGSGGDTTPGDQTDSGKGVPIGSRFTG